jgi:hypothetical protein
MSTNITTLTGNITNQINIKSSVVTTGVGTVYGGTPVNLSSNFTFGTGTGQMNNYYKATLTVAHGTTTTIVLDAGAIKNEYGPSIVFTKIKAVSVQNTSSVAVAVSVAGTAGFTAPKALNAGGKFSIDDQIGYTFTSGQTITIQNSDATNDATVFIFIGGLS